MMGLARAERKASRFIKDLDVDDIHDQIESLRDYVQELSHSAGASAHRRFDRARDYASDAAHEAEEAMKDHLAASLIIALGLGIAVGWLIRRSSE